MTKLLLLLLFLDFERFRVALNAVRQWPMRRRWAIQAHVIVVRARRFSAIRELRCVRRPPGPDQAILWDPDLGVTSFFVLVKIAELIS